MTASDAEEQQSETSPLEAASHKKLLGLVAAAAPFDVAPQSGTPADQPDLHPDPDDLIVAVGEGLQALHRLEVSPLLADDSGQSVATGWEVLADRCRAAITNGTVDPAALPQPYRRYSAEQLLEMCLDANPGSTDDDADTVLCHGQPVLAQFLVSNGSFSGFASLANGMVADRHYDLAVVHQSVQQVLGPEAVFRLYESYGQDPNLAKLEHYVLVSHLLGTAPTQAGT